MIKPAARKYFFNSKETPRVAHRDWYHKISEEVQHAFEMACYVHVDEPHYNICKDGEAWHLAEIITLSVSRLAEIGYDAAQRAELFKKFNEMAKEYRLED